MTGYSGGCQCGAIRYRATSLGSAGICHCRMCQKAFGSWGAVLVSVPANDTTWTRGRPSEFRSSEIVARGFCANCGTPLYMHEDGDMNYEMAVGTLDNPNAIPALEKQSGTESKCRWFDRMSDLPGEATETCRTPADMLKLKSLQHPDHDTSHWPQHNTRTK